MWVNRLKNMVAGIFGTRGYDFVNPEFLLQRYSTVQNYADTYQNIRNRAITKIEFITSVSELIKELSGSHKESVPRSVQRLESSIRKLKENINQYFCTTENLMAIYILRTVNDEHGLSCVGLEYMRSALYELELNRSRYVFYNARANAIEKLTRNDIIQVSAVSR